MDLDYLYHFESIVRVVVPPIFSLIAVVGLVGNLLVVMVVVAGGRRLMHSTTNVLITNLAVADLLFIVFCVPFTATGYALPVWPFGNTWCKVGLLAIFIERIGAVSVWRVPSRRLSQE